MIDSVDEVLARLQLEKQELPAVLVSIDKLLLHARVAMHDEKPAANREVWGLLNDADTMLQAAMERLNDKPLKMVPYVTYRDTENAIDIPEPEAVKGAPVSC